MPGIFATRAALNASRAAGIVDRSPISSQPMRTALSIRGSISGMLLWIPHVAMFGGYLRLSLHAATAELPAGAVEDGAVDGAGDAQGIGALSDLTRRVPA